MTKVKKDHNVQVIKPVSDFKGYSLEEIRYQRALLALRKEFCKARLTESINSLRPSRTRKSDSKSTSKVAIVGKIASKIFSNLNAFDYALMGISALGTIRKGVRLIKGKKK